MVARNADSPAQGWIACVLAALLEERDILRGRPDTLPADLALRVRLVLDLERHDLADKGALHRVRDAAKDIARRSGISSDAYVTADMVDTLCGAIALSAYPDRLAMRRSSAGQFVIREGGAVSCDNKDAIAREAFIVAADVDSRRGGSRLRRAAAVDLELIAPVLGDDVQVESYLLWDKSKDDLVQRVVRKVGSIRIDERDLEPIPGDDTTEALIERVKATGMKVFSGGAASEFRHRIAFLLLVPPDAKISQQLISQWFCSRILDGTRARRLTRWHRQCSRLLMANPYPLTTPMPLHPPLRCVSSTSSEPPRTPPC